MPEVAGDAAILIDPYKSSGIAMAIQKVLSNKNLASKMSKKGVIQASKFRWDDSAKKISSVYKKTYTSPIAAPLSRSETDGRNINLGVVSVWNTNDGLAWYTHSLLKGLSKDIRPVIFARESRKMMMADKSNVVRCWNWDDDLKRLYSEILNDHYDIIHFQFNFDYFRLHALMDLIHKLKSEGIKILVTLHSTDDLDHGTKLKDIHRGLNKVDRIIVHTQKDLYRLKSIGLRNVEILPMGNLLFPTGNGRHDLKKKLFRNSKVVSTFGFPFPHKGTIELIKALKIVRRAYPDTILIDVCSLSPDSTNLEIIRRYHEKCRKTAVKSGLSEDVLFFTDHLPEPEIIELLHASDVVVMPYKPIKDSASGAVRYAIASHRPVIVTDTQIFSEFDREVYKIKDHSPQKIAAGILALFEDKELCNEIVKNAEKYSEENRWGNISKKYESVLRSLA